MFPAVYAAAAAGSSAQFGCSLHLLLLRCAWNIEQKALKKRCIGVKEVDFGKSRGMEYQTESRHFFTWILAQVKIWFPWFPSKYGHLGLWSLLDLKANDERSRSGIIIYNCKFITTDQQMLHDIVAIKGIRNDTATSNQSDISRF